MSEILRKADSELLVMTFKTKAKINNKNYKLKSAETYITSKNVTKM